MKKEFPILYKYTTKGQAQQWQIVVEDNKFYTIEGIVGGKLTSSLPTICKGKNLGKKNETSDNEQALAEAAAKHQKKVDKGYNLKLVAGSKFFEPMLAKDAKESKDITFQVRTFVQPKLDGLRSINENNSLTSRNGKPYVACPHLYQTGVTLDGELYSHEYHDDFNKIVSLCKKQKPTDEDIKESADKVEMWVYDFPSISGPFSKRYEALKGWFKINKFDEKSKFKLVPTYEVKSWEEIKSYHEKFLSEGYEGTIIRLDLGDYENKRSKQLLKYKDFIDEEFKIIGYEEGTGGRTGTIGFFVLQHDKNPEQTFKSNVKGDFEYLKEVWKDRDFYIGATATVKYFQRTPKTEDGGDVPRFPYVIKLKRESYE